MSEIVVLAVIGLIVIGPKDLPEIARTLGRFLNELKRSTDGLTEDFKNQVRLDRLDSFNSIPHPRSDSDQTAEDVSSEDQLSFHEPHGHPPDSEYHYTLDPEQLEFPVLAEELSDEKTKEVKKT